MKMGENPVRGLESFLFLQVIAIFIHSSMSFFIRYLAALIFSLPCFMVSQVKLPAPLLPIPSERQLEWQNLEYYGFLHFTVNTFTDKEWGYGDEPESTFNPTRFDADQIVHTATEAGMKGLILTCKHHDGLCLWPSAFTAHSVKSSPWKGGRGDVVREISDACRKHGIKFGIYLSPWDRNRKDYGNPEYVTYYRNQLRELLTNYGEISEVWFDGANGGDGYYGGAREERFIDKKTYYGWNETCALVRTLQPQAVIFSDVGPDIRWVGNEQGFAGETCWAMYSPVGEHGGEPAPGDTQYEQGMTGQEEGRFWLPAECDVSIRPGWFYHSAEDSLVKSGRELFQLYLLSVGRNGSLLLNIPPDRRGQIHDRDRESLVEFRRLRDMAFSTNLARGASVSASNVRGGDARFAGQKAIDGNSETYWATDDGIHSSSLVLQFPAPQDVNCVVIGEYLALGQRIGGFTVDGFDGTAWKVLTKGTTVGHKRIMTFPTATISAVRVSIASARACPVVSEVGVYRIPIEFVAR